MLNRRQLNQPITGVVKRTKMIFLWNAEQLTRGRIGPRVERADKATTFAPGVLGQPCTAMPTRVQESFEVPVFIARRKHRNTEVINREPGIWFRKVARETDQLRVVFKEYLALFCCHFRANIDVGIHFVLDTGIDIFASLYLLK